MIVTPRFNASTAAASSDPYPMYAELRRAGRSVRGGLGQIVVPGYHDVLALLRSDKLSNEFPPEYRTFAMGDGPAAEFLSRIVLHRDQPAHGPLRLLLGQPLVSRRLPLLTERARTIAAGLLDAALAHPRFDAIATLASPLPILMIWELLGLPPNDVWRMRPHAVAVGRALQLDARAADHDAADASVVSLRDYLGAALSAHDCAAAPPGLIAQARRAIADGFAMGDVVDNLIFLLFAGFETTTSLIGTALAQLAQSPELCDRLRSKPDLLDAFIEECLRFEAPIQSRARIVREPVAVGGKVLRPGRVAVLLIGSANRDPAVFERPDAFDVSRAPNPHLSFGAGAHFCLGHQLAKLETRALLRALLSSRRAIALADAPIFDETSVFRCLRRLELSCVDA